MITQDDDTLQTRIRPVAVAAESAVLSGHLLAECAVRLDYRECDRFIVNLAWIIYQLRFLLYFVFFFCSIRVMFCFDGFLLFLLCAPNKHGSVNEITVRTNLNHKRANETLMIIEFKWMTKWQIFVANFLFCVRFV